MLSAEPLVGLKQLVKLPLLIQLQPFSRTPRGFEAPTVNGVELDGVLSAEPLVGLKPVIAPNVMAPIPHFQPNPSWV